VIRRRRRAEWDGMNVPRPRFLVLTLLLVIVVAAVAAAATGAGKVTAYKARFSTKHVASAAGLHLLTKGKPPAAGTKIPPAIRQTTVLAAGTRIDLTALPQCHASDDQIDAQGAEGACPSSSRVGSGSADGRLNGQPVHFDVGIYAVRGHLVFAAERDGMPLKQSFKGFASGKRTLKLTVPTLNGSIAPTRFEANVPAHPGGAAWLMTPSNCPKSGHWTSKGIFQGRTSAEGGKPVGKARVVKDMQRCHT
jgi:hypothetical protein